MWENGKKKCIAKDYYFDSCELCNNSLFVLHPSDEIPQSRAPGEEFSQIQHGNIHVKRGSMSIAFVFRSVQKEEEYDCVTGLLKLSNNFFIRNQKQISLYESTLDKFRGQEANIHLKMLECGNSKMRKWGWI